MFLDGPVASHGNIHVTAGAQGNGIVGCLGHQRMVGRREVLHKLLQRIDVTPPRRLHALPMVHHPGHGNTVRVPVMMESLRCHEIQCPRTTPRVNATSVGVGRDRSDLIGYRVVPLTGGVGVVHPRHSGRCVGDALVNRGDNHR